MKPEELLFALLRMVICGDPVQEGIRNACSPENLDAAYTLAARHDLAHLVGQAVCKLSLPESDVLARCKQAAMGAFARYAQQNYAYQQVCQALETARIPFIPLKGLVLRDAYPAPWMRTSSDMDILVQEQELDQATELLIRTLGYRYRRKSSHDVSLFSPEGVHLELHYSTIEDFISPDAQRIMARVWQVAEPVADSPCRKQLPDDLFYYYHIAHMAKHFINGGGGIRAFLDLWILEHKVSHSRERREALLKQGGMLPFAQAAEKLSRIWFLGEPADPMSRSMEQYIFSGGKCGSLENRVSINQSKKGGKLRYALSRIFLPYDILQYHYPILQKHKILYPLFQVVRWCKLLFRGGLLRSVRELQTTATVSRDAQMNAAELLKYLHLQ